MVSEYDVARDTILSRPDNVASSAILKEEEKPVTPYYIPVQSFIFPVCYMPSSDK